MDRDGRATSDKSPISPLEWRVPLEWARDVDRVRCVSRLRPPDRVATLGGERSHLSRRQLERCCMSEERPRSQPIPDPQQRVDCMGTDAVLLENLHGGQEAAFEALFRRYYHRVYGMLYRLAGDEAEDLAQEVFLRLYEHPPKRRGTDLGAWLYRVATNLGYNALRARRRQQSYRDLLGRGTAGLGWGHSEPAPETWTVEAEEQRQVRAALARLKERQAALLVLRYSGLSYREIADVLRISSGSVGTLLARAERAFEGGYRQLAGRGDQLGGEE